MSLRCLFVVGAVTLAGGAAGCAAGCDLFPRHNGLLNKSWIRERTFPHTELSAWIWCDVWAGLFDLCLYAP